jgi:hypothetical protein
MGEGMPLRFAHWPPKAVRLSLAAFWNFRGHGLLTVVPYTLS